MKTTGTPGTWWASDPLTHEIERLTHNESKQRLASHHRSTVFGAPVASTSSCLRREIDVLTAARLAERLATDLSPCAFD
jgi:hypothetical protein